MQKELRIYRTKKGKQPFIEWIENLKDHIARSHVTNRLNRIALGNYGDCKFIGDGVQELRIHYGPGYRIYFSEQIDSIVLLLLGGRLDGIPQRRVPKIRVRYAYSQFWAGCTPN